MHSFLKAGVIVIRCKMSRYMRMVMQRFNALLWRFGIIMEFHGGEIEALKTDDHLKNNSLFSTP
jgi:hypothetical protein